MKFTKVMDGFLRTKSRDRVGEKIITTKTEIYEEKDGTYKAFSHYAIDIEESVVGYGESDNPEEAVKFSKEHLKTEWVELKG